MFKSLFAGLTAIYLSITGIFHSPKVEPIVPVSVMESASSTENSQTKFQANTVVETAKIVKPQNEIKESAKVAPATNQSVEPKNTSGLIQVPQQSTKSVSNNEQAAIDYFNKYGSCSNIPDELLSFCAIYSLNHVSDLVIQRKAVAAAEADRLAAERAIKAQAEIDALNDAKPIMIASLEKEYGLKINTLQAQLIEAESLKTEDRMKEILWRYPSPDFPSFVNTNYKRTVVSNVYLRLDATNPVGRGVNNVSDSIGEQMADLSVQIALLQNELERKILELQ